MFTVSALLERTRGMLRSLKKGDSLKSKLAQGGIWLTVGGGSENAVRFLRNIILARILMPEAFGLMAIIMAINNFFETLTYVGMKEAIIQNPRANEKERIFLNGAFIINFTRSVALFILAFFLVPFIADFYHKPQLIPMLRLSFINVLLIGAISPASYLALKKMKYLQWTAVTHGGSLFGVVITIVLGFVLQNVWALVIGFLCESFFRFLFSYLVTPFLPTFRSDRDSLGSLLQFSKGILGLPLLQFLYQRVDIFVLGKMVSDAQLGIYNLATSLAFIPYIICEVVIAHLLMPMFSVLQDDHVKLGAAYCRVTRLIGLFFFPFFTIMACGSHLLLKITYGEIYTGATTVMQVLSACLVLRLIGLISNSVFFAIGKPSAFRLATIFRFIVIGALIVPLIHLFGLVGAVIANFIALVIWLLMVQHMLKKTVSLAYRPQLAALLPGLLVSAALLAGYLLIRLAVRPG
ncbi:MAG: oligosaccharide flippase family protein [Chitinispirillaceae bacterium]|nr:oligosaccharide flippase family protein [Chitinispirillaceae bacterium]